ncbi:hypothetical protein TanjilG_06492 [Lupinus angustifolius]|uniref:Chromo domain-containing protein n=1 Tax=Lupinus angustifolius TaxID=3871 RepID=A0A4P1RFA5_LUPAN|nr:hypothetical protein TanjilG_06492 [Lupinus angustifolius]
MGNSSKDDSATSGDASPGDAQPSNSKLYSSGEKVLAYHGPRIYEAKALSLTSFYFFISSLFQFPVSLNFHVQKAEIRKSEWRYFVHYLGWSKNWDEWVGEDRLMKPTEENVKKQQALDKKQNAEKNVKSGRSSQPKAKTSIDAKVDKEDIKNIGLPENTEDIRPLFVGSDFRDDNSRGCWKYLDLKPQKEPNKGLTKDPQGSESQTALKGSVTVEKLVKIQIPATLKKQLVDDWTFVSQQDKLVKLPRSPTIDEILTKYLEYKTKKDSTVTDSIGESLKGIRRYFDRALPMMLLYTKERKQYTETIVDGVSPSTIYGAEHLLRLFGMFIAFAASKYMHTPMF